MVATYFAGPVAAEWSDLVGLSIVDLSHNSLTGLLLCKWLHDLDKPADECRLIVGSLHIATSTCSPEPGVTHMHFDVLYTLQARCLPAGQPLKT